MEFIFMLTQHDRTVPNALRLLDTALESGITHIGFKDIGATPATLAELARRLREAGATSYLEVVSESSEANLGSARMAVDIGVDKLLGGTEVEATLALLAGSGVLYYPFPGFPVGRPADLGGSAEDVTEHCRRFHAMGCAGVGLLAYRATDDDPLALVRAARAALPDGELVVAGSIDSAARIASLAAAGADAFTIGAAVMDGSFAPNETDVAGRLRAVLDVCRAG